MHLNNLIFFRTCGSWEMLKNQTTVANFQYKYSTHQKHSKKFKYWDDSKKNLFHLWTIPSKHWATSKPILLIVLRSFFNFMFFMLVFGHESRHRTMCHCCILSSFSFHLFIFVELNKPHSNHVNMLMTFVRGEHHFYGTWITCVRNRLCLSPLSSIRTHKC